MSRVCLVYSFKETAKKNKRRLFYFDQIKGNRSSEQRDSLCLSANTKELLQSCLLSLLTGCWMCFCCYSFIIYVQNPISNLHNQIQSKRKATEINVSHWEKSSPLEEFYKWLHVPKQRSTNTLLHFEETAAFAVNRQEVLEQTQRQAPAPKYKKKKWSFKLNEHLASHCLGFVKSLIFCNIWGFFTFTQQSMWCLIRWELPSELLLATFLMFPFTLCNATAAPQSESASYRMIWLWAEPDPEAVATLPLRIWDLTSYTDMTFWTSFPFAA